MTRAQQPTLVLGGTGKIGRRVVERLTARGLPARPTDVAVSHAEQCVGSRLS